MSNQGGRNHVSNSNGKTLVEECTHSYIFSGLALKLVAWIPAFAGKSEYWVMLVVIGHLLSQLTWALSGPLRMRLVGVSAPPQLRESGCVVTPCLIHDRTDINSVKVEILVFLLCHASVKWFAVNFEPGDIEPVHQHPWPA